MVAFSFLIEDIKNSLEDLEKQILIDGKDQDIKGYKKLKSMFSSFYAYLKEKLNLRINIVSKNSNKFQKLIEIINEKEQSEENQMTVLIFVNKRMLAKYMNKLLSLYFNERVGYIVGQSKVADNKGEKSLLLEKEVSNLIKKSQINSIFEKNLDGLNQNLYNNKKTSKMKHYFENKYSLKQQLSVIKQFRDKSIDFLISTSVTEEGFDVPNCNLVIAYNDVKTIRSFIQLKGRARKENSEFLIFSPALLVAIIYFYFNF